MKQLIFILITIFSISPLVKAGTVLYEQLQQDTTITTIADTTIEEKKKEDALIEEVVKDKAVPAKDKVQYFSQVTKYGFKSLFDQYSYNPSLSYSSQVNPLASSFIQDYMKAHGNYLTKMKGWAQPYFNLIEGILSQYGLPRELKYIAVIESNLSAAATSYKGAGGPWQFMPYTARDYGLVVNGYYDERRDYYKSTHAASRYLLNLYRQLHDWLLVMAAYNGGPARVYSAIKKSGSRNFWDLQYYLPEESRTYVKRFIATHYIMEGGGGITTVPNTAAGVQVDENGGANPFDIKPKLTAEEEANAATQTISGKYNSLIIAKNLTMDIVQFNHYNPEFDNMIASNGNYDLKLPQEKMQLFLANKYIILNECVQVLLGENNISSNQTFYPSAKPEKPAPVKKKKGQ
ncbi:MAG: lytic transglycosylase domain-containing protein [Bacteroidetes bacterium]|nr:lytic transglycosylase domain-containing protein [Bacteroidota bacterium]